MCVGRRARGHGKVEARVIREKKDNCELECRIGADILSLVLHAVLNG